MTTTRETKQEVIDKIHKLLRLSKSTNQHEAELAASKANELMAKYQIASGDLEIEKIQSGQDGIGTYFYTVPGLKMKLHWVQQLGLACAILYDGAVLVRSELHGTRFTFVGFKSELPVMVSLFEHLYASWKSIVEVDLELVRDAYKSQRPDMNWSPASTMKFKHGHGQGFAEALMMRCHLLAQERKKAVTNTGTQLVLVRSGALSTWTQQNRVRPVDKINQTEGDQIGKQFGAKAGHAVPLGGALNA